MADNKIHASVREGGMVFMQDNPEHVDGLLKVLTPRGAARLLDLGVVSGEGFVALAGSHDAAESEPTKGGPWDKKVAESTSDSADAE